jgi:uncharacterized surface protein with fasciclin (FAS1) repeats
MKKLSYIGLLAMAMIFAANQTGYAQSARTNLSVPCPTSTTMPSSCQNPLTTTAGIVDTLKSQPSFSAFSTLLEVSGVDKMLNAQGPYTIFAPTDEAFTKLPKGTTENLVRPENRANLAKLIRYHIVNELVPCGKLACPLKIRTAEGSEFLATQREGKLFINDAEVLQGDISTQNGKIYTIDKVLMPGK